MTGTPCMLLASVDIVNNQARQGGGLQLQPLGMSNDTCFDLDAKLAEFGGFVEEPGTLRELLSEQGLAVVESRWAGWPRRSTTLACIS